MPTRYGMSMSTEPSSPSERQPEEKNRQYERRDEQSPSPDHAADGPLTPVHLVTNPYALGLSILLGAEKKS